MQLSINDSYQLYCKFCKFCKFCISISCNFCHHLLSPGAIFLITSVSFSDNRINLFRCVRRHNRDILPFPHCKQADSPILKILHSIIARSCRWALEQTFERWRHQYQQYIPSQTKPNHLNTWSCKYALLLQIRAFLVFFLVFTQICHLINEISLRLLYSTSEELHWNVSKLRELLAF